MQNEMRYPVLTAQQVRLLIAILNAQTLGSVSDAMDYPEVLRDYVDARKALINSIVE